MSDALSRAEAYTEAGSDGILIHSRKSDGKEIFEFMEKFRTIDQRTPIAVVPTSYNQFKNEEFSEAGANIIIYANHLLRSSYPSMVKTANSILEHQRSMEADDNLMSIKEILNLIPES
jgi:2-methylisocitrate lyase-like PEP mutase family enzyme